MKTTIALLILGFFTQATAPVYAANPPKIDYWQTDLAGGGIKLFEALARQADKDGGKTAFGGMAFLILLAAMGWDLYPVEIKFSNPHNLTIFVEPNRFRISAFQGGQSYPLGMFVFVQQNGKAVEWKSVRMPPGTSVKVYGYHTAPMNFKAKLMTVVN